MRCRSIAFAYVLLPVALAGVVSASDDERTAGATAEHWYDADGSRKECSTREHPYQRQLCPCERAADAVIACVPDVAYQGLHCWPYDKGIEECLRRKGLANTTGAFLPIRDTSSTKFDHGQHDSLDQTNGNAPSLPPPSNSANISEDVPTDRAAVAMYAAMSVCGVIFLWKIAPMAISIIFHLVKGKKKHLHCNEDLETGEALRKGKVQERPG